jgi:hypothetical protein
MTEEEKGFVVKDKRAFDEKGDLKEKEEQGEKVEKEVEKEKEEPEDQSAGEDTITRQFPEVNFSSLIFSLSSTALFHFGEVADPRTGEKKKDLSLAKHTIDTIAMLKEKTEGNLTEEEKKFLESILTDLRWRYVKNS